MAKTNTVTVSRAYDHKRFGRIGVAEFVVPVSGPVTLNGNELPESSIMHLFTFALQTLQDAYAGADNETDAQAAFKAKLDRIINGTIGVRTGGESVDPFVAAVRYVMRPFVKKSFNAVNDAEAWKALDEADIASIIDDAYASLSDDDRAAVDAAANARMEELEKVRKAKAGLGAIAIKLG